MRGRAYRGEEAFTQPPPVVNAASKPLDSTRATARRGRRLAGVGEEHRRSAEGRLDVGPAPGHLLLDLAVLAVGEDRVVPRVRAHVVARLPQGPRASGARSYLSPLLPAVGLFQTLDLRIAGPRIQLLQAALHRLPGVRDPVDPLGPRDAGGGHQKERRRGARVPQAA